MRAILARLERRGLPRSLVRRYKRTWHRRSELMAPLNQSDVSPEPVTPQPGSRQPDSQPHRRTIDTTMSNAGNSGSAHSLLWARP